jgi:hypothetical protein
MAGSRTVIFRVAGTRDLSQIDPHMAGQSTEHSTMPGG